MKRLPFFLGITSLIATVPICAFIGIIFDSNSKAEDKKPVGSITLPFEGHKGVVLGASFTGASNPPSGYSGGATPNAPYMYNNATGAVLVDTGGTASTTNVNVTSGTVATLTITGGTLVGAGSVSVTSGTLISLPALSLSSGTLTSVPNTVISSGTLTSIPNTVMSSGTLTSIPNIVISSGTLTSVPNIVMSSGTLTSVPSLIISAGTLNSLPPLTLSSGTLTSLPNLTVSSGTVTTTPSTYYGPKGSILTTSGTDVTPIAVPAGSRIVTVWGSGDSNLLIGGGTVSTPVYPAKLEISGGTLATQSTSGTAAVNTVFGG